MSFPICPCDAEPIAAPVNLPGLNSIAYRVGTYTAFREAVLTPLLTPATPVPLPVEQSLSVGGVPVWRTDGASDLAVMIAEWFAYVADIIAFYNERIANQDYLRTADLPESVNNLIAVLGYRPRPAIGAVGTLAALVSPGPTFGGRATILPKGLQFQSKPTPGLPPQTFELAADTAISQPDQITATPAPVLLGPVTTGHLWVYTPYNFTYGYHTGKGYLGHGGQATETIVNQSTLLLRGAVTTVNTGDLLRLRAHDASVGGPWLVSVVNATIQPAPSGLGQQTNLTVSFSTTSPPATLSAVQASLETPNQSTATWTIFTGAINGKTVHLASIVRQIHAGDWLLFTAASGGPPPLLAQVASAIDALWDLNGDSSDPTASSSSNPIPIPHTQLTLMDALSSDWTVAPGVSVWFGWAAVGKLLDQPFSTWTGVAPAQLVDTSTPAFPAWSSQQILLQDSTGLGIDATAASAGDANLSLSSLPNPVPPLQPPFLVLPNTLPVTRGKTVMNEVLGSGDAANPAQDFKLAQSPVTYLSQGSSYVSTISLTVGGLPWKEVASFYNQPPDATVFVTREDNDGSTHVMFGDGVNGARLPNGTNNIVATYRVGAGAASPPAGKLTVIAKSYPGLRAVLNPVAVGAGADPDQPAQIRRNAPRSVLTFQRAVSVFDYQTLAAQVAGVTRASAVWTWNDAQQRALVTVYVGDNSAAATAAQSSLAAAGDPNRPVVVVQATQIAVALIITLVVTPGMDQAVIGAAVATALTDTQAGLFGSWNMGIGQTLFDSQIEATILAVSGAVAITSQTFLANGNTDPGPLHNPGEASYYTLDPADIQLNQEADPNG